MGKFCKQTRDDHVQDKYWVYVYGSPLQKMTFSKNYLHVGLQCRSPTGRNSLSYILRQL